MEKISYNKTLNKYYEVYNKEILPIFEQFEPYRKILARKYLFSLAFKVISAILFTLPLLYVILMQFNKQLEAYFLHGSFGLSSLFWMLTPLLIIPAIFLHDRRRKQVYSFFTKLKILCFPKLLKNFDNISWAFNFSSISEDEIEKSDIFMDLNAGINYDDSFDGRYKDVDFRISEINIAYNLLYIKLNIFSGVLVSLEFNKKIGSKTVFVSHKNLLRTTVLSLFALLPFLCLMVCGIIKDMDALFAPLIPLSPFWILIALNLFKVYNLQKGAKINLEDVKANKNLRAFSKDQVEGRYLLTPAFIERFKNLRKAFNSKSVSCSFYDNNVLFAFETNKNVFEIGSVKKPLGSKEFINDFFNEIYSIYNMIDYLKLDEKTGL